jgi:regulatory protein YycI of two-component signal transduction system YycFG
VNKITETFKEGRRNKKRKKKVKKQSIRAAQQPVNTADMAEKNLQTGMREKFKLSKKRQ